MSRLRLMSRFRLRSRPWQRQMMLASDHPRRKRTLRRRRHRRHHRKRLRHNRNMFSTLQHRPRQRHSRRDRRRFQKPKRKRLTPKLRRLDAVRQEQEVRPLRDRKQLEGTARQQWTSPSRCAASNSHSTEDTAPTRISTSTSWSRCSDWRSGPKTRTRRGTSCGRHYSRHNRIRRWVWECFHTK